MIKNYIKHFKTICQHKKYVGKACFKMGIPWLGITHDLSKFTPKEFSIAKYYSGKRSPHAECRDKIGYSPSWLNHYHKNKHHWQYWLDAEDYPDKIIPIKMPYKYVIEMFCDFVGAGKAYNPGNWNVKMPMEYWEKSCEGKRLMHKSSECLLKILLRDMAAMDTEESFYQLYKAKKDILKEQYENDTLKY